MSGPSIRPIAFMNPARAATVSPRTSADNAQPLIVARGLSKAYGGTDAQRVLALKNLDFQIYDGEFVSVVGQSGCGKSTLLKILAGLLPYSAGSIELNGKPLRGPSPEAAVVFQSPVLLPWRTVIENVLLPIEFRKLRIADYRQKAADLLALVGLQDFAQRYPFELSGGMQQRAAIVRALVQDPRLLLMDEPFGALDALTREQLQNELLQIWKRTGVTTIFVTHSVEEAVLLADRVLVMSAGPGRIDSDFRIDLPRPRDVSSPEFNALRRDVARRLTSHLALART
jgi:ABC-type nitrate/sulfonate/bicarbonate transport system ATPase subunit